MNIIVETKRSASWYVAYTYPNYEKKVQKLLHQKNINCYLPVQQVMRQWSDRKKLIEVPLFPNYIFINTTAHEKYEALAIAGISKFVSFGGEPAVLSDKDIETIRKITSENIEISSEQTFEQGDYIRILEGPFAGMHGYLFERKGKTRFAFKLEAIEQAISIEINIAVIEKIRRSNEIN